MLDYTTADQVLQRFKTGHLWLGTINISEDEYLVYFNQDNLAENKYCDFCKDIGLNEEYDEDFIIIFPLLEQPIPINELMIEIPLRNDEEILKVEKCCEEIGIKEANTFVFYSDQNLIIDKFKNYNGLTYIGEFLAEC